MLRLVPTCEGGSFAGIFRSIGAIYREFSTLGNALEVRSTNRDEHESKQIDFDILFGSCTNLQFAKRLHARLVVSSRIRDVFISVKLVNLYAYLGDVALARGTFDRIHNKDVYAWNSMISAYGRVGYSTEAIRCFSLFMSKSGLWPDFYTLPPVLKACRDLLDGMKLHCLALKFGFEWDVYVAASLVHMYSRFGLVLDARKLFDDMPIRDMGSWNAMISGYSQTGNAKEALHLADEMRAKGVNQDPRTIASLLSACAEAEDLNRGKSIHLYSVKHGLDSELFVANALINMYSIFGNLGDCQKMFDEMMIIRDVVSWNSIIKAYEQNKKPLTAVWLFKEMGKNGIQYDRLTLISLASALAQLGDSLVSRSAHAFTLKKGWFFEDVTVGNAVVDMYAKLGLADSARTVFDWLPAKDVISWNTIISGYAQNGLATEAIQLFNLMEEIGEITPNQGTWVSILPAYSHQGALHQGMKTHARVLKNRLYLDVFVGTSLVDMYGKCGQLDDALSLFYEIPRFSSVPWNAIISCLGGHGHGRKAMMLFREMLDEGVSPDHLTFISLLSACSHSGLIEEGQWCFDVMQEDYGITPSLKHYGCMVDLYGRAGHIETAYSLIKGMPLRPDSSIWGALLGACRIHGNVDLGKIASEHLFEVDPENVGYYVLLSNVYASAGKWEGVDKVRAFARDRGLRKTPGWSSMELGNKVEVFYTGNQTHPKWKEIYDELTELNSKMKMLGYVPDYSFVLQDVEDDEKEQILMGHSERLAIAFGIISTGKGTVIRIFKNLRVCGDCHTVTKFISRITGREIVVRDSNRFHHFKDGICSCGDYW
ncbi:PREDICTED: pentatricopeptide repeat-containing protein At4g33990 [Tarenaya hassleriana]|uniref:pentatricopeptide repeat-containing protein At4g33990 n=1 Tax=Tarenaya hassleriana TaxID=28532 RepID=UPI00053C2913|nr:PREDICTED: pentatricopeptide repeat-containing protein At4g33990 [Tarenaya hassleriana]